MSGHLDGRLAEPAAADATDLETRGGTALVQSC
jgi:hypothetical protein